MMQYEIGRVPVSRGEYSAEQSYYKYNEVTFNNVCYECIVDGPVINIQPDNDLNIWRLKSGTPVTQETGDSIQSVMSQKSVTDKFNEIIDMFQVVDELPIDIDPNVFYFITL